MVSRIQSPGIKIDEETILCLDGINIHSKRWSSTTIEPPRALLIALHGFGEHIGRYDHVWPLFAQRAIEVLAYDQRGFGRSGPTHGDTTLSSGVEDLSCIVTQEQQRLSKRGLRDIPLFIYAHSMGACIVLSLLTQRQDTTGNTQSIAEQVHGIICTAPWILRAKPPSGFVLWLAPWLLWLLPNIPFYKTINPSGLTSDVRAMESYEDDPFHNGNVYLKTILEPLLFGYKLLEEGYQRWPASLPILISHGDEDKSTSVEASSHFIDKIECVDKELKVWPGMLHEGHNERPGIRDPFLEYSISWIERRCRDVPIVITNT